MTLAHLFEADPRPGVVLAYVVRSPDGCVARARRAHCSRRGQRAVARRRVATRARSPAVPPPARERALVARCALRGDRRRRAHDPRARRGTRVRRRDVRLVQERRRNAARPRRGGGPPFLRRARLHRHVVVRARAASSSRGWPSATLRRRITPRCARPSSVCRATSSSSTGTSAAETPRRTRRAGRSACSSGSP